MRLQGEYQVVHQGERRGPAVQPAASSWSPTKGKVEQPPWTHGVFATRLVHRFLMIQWGPTYQRPSTWEAPKPKNTASDTSLMTDLEGVGWGCLREDAEKRCSGLVTGPSLSAAATLAAEPLQAWPQHRRRYIHESTWLFWHSVMSSHPQSCYGHVIKHFTQYDSEDKPHHSIVILISRDGEKGCNLITKMKYLRF